LRLVSSFGFSVLGLCLSVVGPINNHVSGEHKSNDLNVDLKKEIKSWKAVFIVVEQYGNTLK